MAELFSVKGRKPKDFKDRDIQFNRMLKRWKNKFNEYGIKEELVSRKEFVKPSLQKRKQMQEAVRNNERLVNYLKEENA